MTDEKTLEKVRKLLAQAEDQAGTPEGEVFSKRAEEMMIRHGIEQDVLDAAEGKGKGDLGATRLFLPTPYAKEKSALAGAIIDHNQCQGVVHWKRTRTGRLSAGSGLTVSVYGFDRDRSTVEFLFTSLSVQAVKGMHAAFVPIDEDPATFRASWMLGFANGVRQRMAEMSLRAQRDADSTSTGAAVVLADKQSQVEQYVASLYPHVSQGRAMRTSGSGVGAGRRAGRSADLGQQRFSGGRKQLAT